MKTQTNESRTSNRSSPDLTGRQAKECRHRLTEHGMEKHQEQVALMLIRATEVGVSVFGFQPRL